MLCLCVCVSKQRGAPRPESTRKVTRKRGTISAKVNGAAEGLKKLRNLKHSGTSRANPTSPFLSRSAEKAARWWPFQKSPLPWLPVPHDTGPHQPLPVQWLAVPRCQNSKLSLFTPPTTPPLSPPKPSPSPSFTTFSWQRNMEGRLSKKEQKLGQRKKKFLVRF